MSAIKHPTGKLGVRHTPRFLRDETQYFILYSISNFNFLN